MKKKKNLPPDFNQLLRSTDDKVLVSLDIRYVPRAEPSLVISHCLAVP